MKKYVVIVLSLIVVLGLLSIAVYKYENRPKPKPGETLQQAVAAQAKAEKTMKQHDMVNTVIMNNANSQIAALTAQKSTLCTQIKTAKLPQPLCP